MKEINDKILNNKLNRFMFGTTMRETKIRIILTDAFEATYIGNTIQFPEMFHALNNYNNAK